jgi:hypothetical protein
LGRPYFRDGAEYAEVREEIEQVTQHSLHLAACCRRHLQTIEGTLAHGYSPGAVEFRYFANAVNRQAPRGSLLIASIRRRLNSMREIQLSGGLAAWVDDEDFDKVSGYIWSLEQRGPTRYAVCYLDPSDLNRCLRMHRLIMAPQPNEVVDHIDGDGLNNQRANLRVCSQAQNTRNRRKLGGWTSRFKGVSLAKGRCEKCWRAQIRQADKVRNLGYFASESEAALAYDVAAQEAFGNFARLNFPSAAFLTTGRQARNGDNPTAVPRGDTGFLLDSRSHSP